MRSPTSLFKSDSKRLGQTMTATMRRIEGTGATTDGGGEVLIDDAPVSMGVEAQVTQAGDYRFFAGWRSDPFFFDEGALNHFQLGLGTTSSATRTFAELCFKFPTHLSGAGKVGYGHGSWSGTRTVAGCRRTGVRGLRKPRS